MDPLLITGIGLGIYKALEKLAEKGIIDPALEHGLEKFNKWLTKGYDEAKDLEELHSILLAALDDLCKEYPSGDPERLIATWKLTGLNQEQLIILTASAVEMIAYNPDILSMELLNKLGMRQENRKLLAKFLYYFRKRLASSDKYRDGIHFADEANQRGLLIGLSEQILNLQEQTNRTNSYLDLLIQSRRLSGDDSQVLKEYLEMARQRWGNIMLPLIRKRSGDTIPYQLKRFFVPLQMRDRAAEEQAKIKKPSAKGKNQIDEEKQIPPIGLGDLLNNHSRFILIGSPGCGKTTLLRRMALAFAEGRATEDLGWKGNPALLPIFFRLRNFGVFLARHQSEFPAPCHGAVVAFLENQYQEGERHELSPKFFDHRLQEGNCLVLLDGLDEVSENRSEVAQYLREFINYYGQQAGNRFGLSSRPKGYETVEWQLRSANLAIADVHPLEPDGIQQLIENLFSLIEPDPQQSKKDSEGLVKSIFASHDLTEIASTPLFCSALVQVYKYHGAHLPERRVDVLDEIVHLMLGFWRAQQGVAGAENLAIEDGTGKQRKLEDAVKTKRQRLSFLAYQMQENRQLDLETTQATNLIANYMKDRERVTDDDIACQWAEAFLINSHEQSGLLAELEPGKYSFIHKAFMEFLAATWLVNRNDVIPVTMEHLGDDWWEPVILLAGAHPNLSEGFQIDLINGLVDRYEAEDSDDAKSNSLLMAGKLTVDMAESLPGPEHERTEHALLAAMIGTSLPAKVRASAGVTLARLGDPRPEVMSVDGMRFCFVPAGEFWVGAGKEAKKLPQPAFWLAEFPVSNAQFKEFVADEGYLDERWWPEARQADRWQKGKGYKEWRSEEFIRQPLDPGETFNLGNHPRIMVSWYEAMAFTHWLSARWGQQGRLPAGWQVSLPQEQQWEKAVRGGLEIPEAAYTFPLGMEKISASPTPSIPVQVNPSAQRECPWQGEFESSRANTSESGIGATSALGCFPLGASPYGIQELSGNVWEWQENWYDKDQDSKALRGGSWSRNQYYARVSPRYGYNPGLRFNNFGFRCVFSPKS